MFSLCVCMYVCVHVDFLFFFLPEMVNKVEYITSSLVEWPAVPILSAQFPSSDFHFLSFSLYFPNNTLTLFTITLSYHIPPVYSATYSSTHIVFMTRRRAAIWPFLFDFTKNSYLTECLKGIGR